MSRLHQKTTLIILLMFSLSIVSAQKKTERILLKIEKSSLKEPFTSKYISEKSYRFCAKWIDDLKYLNTHIEDSKIDELIKSSNGTLTFIGHLLKLNRNNNLKFFLNTLEENLKKESKFLNLECKTSGDIISVNYYLLLIVAHKSDLGFYPKFDVPEDVYEDYKQKISNN